MLHVLCMTPSSIPIFTVGRDNITKCVCVCVCACACKFVHKIYSSFMTSIGVREVHG